MKLLLLALGLPTGMVAAWYAALAWAPWLVWLLPLLACLGALAYVRGGWAAEAVPYFKATLDELTSGHLSANLRQRLDIDLYGRGVTQRWGDNALHIADAVLARIWGGSTWDKPALERALVVAFVYPLVLLLLVWLVSGVGTLGNTTVLPADWGFAKRLLWASVMLLGSVLGYLVAYWLITKFLPMGWITYLAASSAGIAASTAFFIFIGTPFHAIEMAYFGSGVCAGTIAGARAGNSTVFGARAISGLVVVTNALSIFLFFLVGGFVSVDVVVTGAISIALLFAAEYISDSFYRRGNARWGALIWYVLLFGGVLLIAAIWSSYELINPVDLADDAPFITLVFSSLLPLFNALCDWISVGATRFFIHRYLAGQMGVWRFLAMDGLIAVAMMLALYVGTVGLFLAMQHWGWPLDANSLLAAFRADPVSPQASWVTAMAVTNLLPTFLHLSVAVVGLATGRLHGSRHSLATAFNRLQPAGLHIPGNSAPSATTSGLTKREAYAVLNYLYFDRWLGTLLAVCLIVALWPLLTHAVAWSLTWF